MSRTDVTHRTWTEIKDTRLQKMTTEERAEFDRGDRLAALQTAIGEQVRTARDKAGLSQRDLASQMGTSQAAIARLEAGGVGPTVTTLQRVADALGLSLTVELTRPAG
jgi:ribosome-binding protein aMBF1 (putative translation factor)